jgi:hypothetical protein
MEKKVYLWLALILGVPLLRLVEVFGIRSLTGELRGESLLGHIGLALIIGIGCAMGAQLTRMTDRRVLWAMPLLAVVYVGALVLPSYPARFLHQDPTFVLTLLLMDFGSWAIAVFGSALVGHVVSRPSAAKQLAADPLARPRMTGVSLALKGPKT